MSGDTSTGERWRDSVAQAIPGFPWPLRTDPKPRAVWPAYLTHLPDGQWPLGLPVPREPQP